MIMSRIPQLDEVSYVTKGRRLPFGRERILLGLRNINLVPYQPSFIREEPPNHD
jgi:hypothetical protein